MAVPDITGGMVAMLLRDATDPFTDAVREAARADIRTRVGDWVFAATRPKTAVTGAVQITVQWQNARDFAALAAPAGPLVPLLEIDVWGRDTDTKSGQYESRMTAAALWQMLQQFRGPFTDDLGALQVQTITNETWNELPTQPRERSDAWVYRWATSWEVAVEVDLPTGVD